MSEFRSAFEVVGYLSLDDAEIPVFLQLETLWLSRASMAALLGITPSGITYQLREIYRTGELVEFSTSKKVQLVQKEGKRHIIREVTFYHLDVVISVCYRVDPYRATQFRLWATRLLTQRLKKNLLKAYRICSIDLKK